MPVFRVAGYPPDAPETQILMEAFAGSVKQFYSGQARNYALSSGEQWRKMVDRGDHQILYQASHGTEIVTLRVHPKRAAGLLTPGDGWWDSALVEISIPATLDVAGFFSAFVVAPLLEEITPDSELPVKGVAKDYANWVSEGAAHQPDLIVAYPDYAFVVSPQPESRGAVSNQTASLRIDLRPFRGLTNIDIELWGAVIPEYGLRVVDSQLLARYGHNPDFSAGIDPPVNALFGATLAGVNYAKELFPELASATVQYPRTAFDGFEEGVFYWFIPNISGGMTEAKWNAGNWMTVTPEDYLAAYPPKSGVTYWRTGIVKTTTHGGCIFTGDFDQVWTDTPIPTPPPYLAGFADNADTYRFTVSAWDYIDYYEPEYGMDTELVPREGVVTGALFLGMPFNVWSTYTADGNEWRQWEVSQTYPNRPGLMTLGEVTVPAVNFGTETLQNKWDQRFLGTISIDPRRHPERKAMGIYWKPA